MRLLVSTGEVSGDLQGSFLIYALKKEAKKRLIPLELIALGGPRMQAAGADLLADTSNIGAIGFWEALPLIIPTLKVQSKVDSFLKKRPFDGVVLIDYMGPNIRLGNKLRQWKKNIPIIYYIAPQEWAWRLGDGGSTDLIKFSDIILAIFKKEYSFYRKRGGNVVWVGHPMLDNIKKLPSREESFKRLGINLDQKVLLLLPASRRQEIKYIMPILAKAAALLQKYDPTIYILVPAGLPYFEEPLKKILNEFGVRGEVISSKNTDELKPVIFSVADLAIGKSGTINMELALNNVPQIVGYRVSRVTAFIARKILRFKVDHISPVNLLLKERLVPEFVQEEFTSQAIFSKAISLLDDINSRSSMMKGYKKLQLELGEPGVTSRAAKEIIDLVSK